MVGKPSPEFFESALQQMGVEAHQVGCSESTRGGGGSLGRPGALRRGSRGARGAPGLRQAAEVGRQPRVDPAVRANLAGSVGKTATGARCTF